MKLSDYLTKQKLTDAAFSEAVGMSQSQISRLRRNKSKPSFSTIKLIAEKTKNKVRAQDWYAV